MHEPTISICLPVRNGVEWIDQAIDSALAQTRDDFELLVVENASTDGTADVVRRRVAEDPRIRLERCDDLVSAPANHNRAIRLARGALVKFLHADDVLYPRCLERLAAILEEEPRVGLVFGRRTIRLDPPDTPEGLEWARRYGTLHDRFAGLARINDGHALLAQYLPDFTGPEYRNWIGEPSAVMVRRSCFARVGAFTDRLLQSWDLELWLRIFAVSDVGFVDEPVCEYRFNARSLTASNARLHTDWLDLLWLYEGLLAEPALAPYGGLIRRLRRRHLRRIVRKQLGRFARRNFDLSPLGSYASYRARRRTGRPARMEAGGESRPG